MSVEHDSVVERTSKIIGEVTQYTAWKVWMLTKATEELRQWQVVKVRLDYSMRQQGGRLWGKEIDVNQSRSQRDDPNVT